MLPFLKSVARAYASRYSDLSKFCFLFPNKRSGTFFLKYLREECHSHFLLTPQICTITEFVADLSGSIVASRLDLLFMLYQCYRELRGLPEVYFENEEDSDDFDKFRGWGETVLSDFNEIDLYLADAETIFKNVKDYRDISSNFLTEEQKEVIAEYFGRREKGSADSFWQNFDDQEGISETKKSFLYLWRHMWPLYNMLNIRLSEKGLATSGGAYRNAVVNLRKQGRDIIHFKKIVVVGFNALSASETAIFMELRDFTGYDGYDSFCDFFWDATGPVLSAGGNSASRFVKTNLRHFPQPAWASNVICQSESVSMPRLCVVASPSNSAQVKIAGNLLSDLSGRIAAREITDAKVAVVLPDENLLLPMLYSLPRGMGNVNLTMGYPLRFTSVVSFVRQLRLLYRNRKAAGGPDLSFYHKDLRLILSHPFSHILFGSSVVSEIIGFLDKHHRTTLSLIELETFVKDGEMDAFDFTTLDKGESLIAFLDKILAKVEDRMPPNGNGMVKTRLERDHIKVYRDALVRLGDLLTEYKIPVNPYSTFHLVDKLLAGTTVGFEGEPLTGLQVMGTLETRSIDFDHIFILSMNERVMPQKLRTRSFIPDSLRYAYGLPPSNYAESIFSYYFFRMISRAKEVTMIYDARSGGGMRSGDVSRYILQLRYLYADNIIENQNWKFQLSGKIPYDPSVEKSREVMERLLPFEKDGPGGINFSASSLNSYRECQTKFFYRCVMGIDTDPEPSEFIDAIGVGNILHAMMENLYLPDDMRGRYLDVPVMMRKETIDRLIDDKDLLIRTVTRLVNSHHFRLPEDKVNTPLTGAAEIVARQIIAQAIRVMKRDRRLAPFKIYGCEIKEKLRINLKSGRTVNFKFAIDRLDEIEVDGVPTLRIVDYKTGRIKLKAESLDEVFSGDYRAEQVFQLFTYAWLLQKTGRADNRSIRMEIYDVPKIFNNQENLPIIAGQTVNDFLEYAVPFSEGLEDMLESVFSHDRFVASDDMSGCRMCSFRTLCRRW